MHNDASCTGFRRWFCPSLVGAVAGLMVLSAGIMKLFMGTKAFTMVGGMGLGAFGLDAASMPDVANALGMLVAIIEVVGGISFIVGCRLTSKWAALFLSIIMAVAILFKLQNLSPLEGHWLQKCASFIIQLQVELILFAVFFTKALRFLKKWCGMD